MRVVLVAARAVHDAVGGGHYLQARVRVRVIDAVRGVVVGVEAAVQDIEMAGVDVAFQRLHPIALP
jgi:hypothetical protein